MNGQAAEEDEAKARVMSASIPAARSTGNVQEGDPSKVLEESTQEITMAQAVLQEGERNVTSGREHNHTSEPDFETVEIPPIDIDSESK